MRRQEKGGQRRQGPHRALEGAEGEGGERERRRGSGDPGKHLAPASRRPITSEAPPGARRGGLEQHVEVDATDGYDTDAQPEAVGRRPEDGLEVNRGTSIPARKTPVASKASAQAPKMAGRHWRSAQRCQQATSVSPATKRSAAPTSKSGATGYLHQEIWSHRAKASPRRNLQ